MQSLSAIARPGWSAIGSYCDAVRNLARVAHLNAQDIVCNAVNPFSTHKARAPTMPLQTRIKILRAEFPHRWAAFATSRPNAWTAPLGFLTVLSAILALAIGSA